MNELMPKSVIDVYTKVCNILYETEKNGDYKRGNSEYKKIVKVFHILEKDIDLARNSLPMLFTSANVVTRTKAAAHCISLGICVVEAEKILTEIADKESANVFGLNAKMTLICYKKQGYLKVYQTQKILI